MNADKKLILHRRTNYHEPGSTVRLHEIYALADQSNPDAMRFVENDLENDNVKPMLCAEMLL